MPVESAESRLEPIARLLLEHQVEFLVIGGEAEHLMGSPRITYDVDLCYRRTPENLQRLADAMRPLQPTLRGAPKDLPFRFDAQTLAHGSNFTFDTTRGPIDLLGHVEPLGDYDRLAQSAEEFDLADFKVKTIGLDDLIRVKRHIQRDKDRESLRQLLAIKRLREAGF